MPLPSNWRESLQDQSFIMAVIAIVLHVINYNFTAQLEYKTRIFTKMFGKSAIYIYAIYLVASALLRDYFIKLDISKDAHSLQVAIPAIDPNLLGSFLFLCGTFLNLWTLHELGIKGMYNGDSFGWLFSEPVTGGPFRWFSDPQYFGTSIAVLGTAIYFQSFRGLLLSVVVYTVFMLSVDYIEGPHMKKIYLNRATSDLYSTVSKNKKKNDNDGDLAGNKATEKSNVSSFESTSKTPGRKTSSKHKAVKAAASPVPTRNSPRKRTKTD